MNNTVKIGIIQMNILSDMFDYEVRKKNINTAKDMMISLLEEESEIDLIVLPEEFYAGSGYGPLSMPDNVETVEENVVKPFKEIAQKYNVYIIGALNVKLNNNEFKSNNIGFIIGRDGNLVGYQERFHQSSSEVPYSFSGKEYKVFDLDFGKISLLIGNDILFPEVARNFVLNGAEILISPIISPGVNEEEYDKYRYPNDLFLNCASSRALENQVFLVLANGVGRFAHVDLPIFGESAIFGPLGRISQLGKNESTLISELHLDDKKKASKNYPLLEMRNKDACEIKA